MLWARSTRGNTTQAAVRVYDGANAALHFNDLDPYAGYALNNQTANPIAASLRNPKGGLTYDLIGGNVAALASAVGDCP